MRVFCHFFAFFMIFYVIQALNYASAYICFLSGIDPSSQASWVDTQDAFPLAGSLARE